MNQQEVMEELKKAGALLTGHFKLSSGLHSDAYVQCALAFCRPLLAERLGEALAEKLGYPEADIVLGPALGGVVIAQEVARALSKHHKREVLSLFSEHKETTMELRRGFAIHTGDQVVMVEDVVTTGKSILEAAELVKQAGGNIIGWATTVDRSGGAFKSTPSLTSLVSMDLVKHEPDNCPLCRDGVPMIKPGSRPENR